MFGIDFSFLRKSREQLIEKREKMFADLEDLRRQRDRVLSAPGSKEDLKAMLGDWVASNSGKYRAQLRETLLKFTRSPRSMTPHDLVNVMSLAGPPSTYGEAVATANVDQALCGLFGPLLKTALVEEIDGMEWHSHSLTAVERQAQADDLDKRITDLQKEINALNAAAEEAGVEWPRFGHFN